MQAPHDDVSQPTFVPVSDEPLAQHVDEQVARLDLELVTRSVDGQGYRVQGRPPSIDGTPPSLLLAVRRGQARGVSLQAMIEIREIGADELERWLAVATAVRPDRAGSVGDYVDWKRQAEDMAWFVASVDGEDAGCALAYVGWHSAPGTGTGEAFVLPEHRGAGVGSALYRELAGWVQERGCVTLETTVAEDDAASLAWADRRGFREVGRTSRLVLDLTAIEAPAVDPPEGVEIVTWAERPDLTPRHLRGGLRGVPGRARRGGHARWTPFEAWLSKDMRGDSDRPEATFIALADGEVAGYAKLSLSSSRTNVAIHDMTGVRRAFRGRGIAGALKRAEIAWAKQAGYERLETSNEVRNEPIRRLNERHGYTVQPGVVVLHDSLAGIDVADVTARRRLQLAGYVTAPSAPAPSAAWRRGRRSCGACRPCPCPGRARSRPSPCRP